EALGSGRAAEVLPDRCPQLRPRRRHRRLPGPCGRDVVEVARLQEGLRPERRADLRLRRRDDVQERGEEARHPGRRLQGLGREAVELRVARQPRQGLRSTGRLPRRHRLQQRRQADAGSPVGRAEREASDAGRVQRPARERRSRTGRVHQRRRPAAEVPDGRRCDLRQELRQADRHRAESVLPVRRSGDAGRASGRSVRPRCPSAVEQGHLRPPHHRRAKRSLSSYATPAAAGLLLCLLVLWLGVNFVKGPAYFFTISFIGLTNGAVYALVALGYTLVYGILELINFAHGDLFMLGGMISATMLITVFGLKAHSSTGALVVALLGSLAVAMVACGLINASIEFVAYRPLRGAPRLAPLITAVGMSFILQNVAI